MPDTLTLELHLHPLGPDGRCDVDVRGPGDRRASGSFAPPFEIAQIEQARVWMEEGAFDAELAKTFGADLFRTLFTGEIAAVYQGSLLAAKDPGAVHTIRTRLQIEDPVLAQWPWELLFDPERQVFLALQGPFVRGISLTEPTHALAVKPPLRVLVVDAFPKGVARVDGQWETQGIETALAELVRRHRAEVVRLPNVTLAALQNALRESVADPTQPRPFHVLHFIGHGRSDPETGQTILLFEGEDGKPDAVDPEALANVLRPHAADLKLVFLNACQSVQATSLSVTSGFAPALLACGIPAVIGMQVTVLDTVAGAFGRRFYEALADNQPVDAALADARRLARGTALRHKSDMGIPVCFLRPDSGLILQFEAILRTPLTRATWRAWLAEQLAAPGMAMRAAATTLLLLGIVATSLSLADHPAVRGAVCDLTPYCPRPVMTGDLNVAVAQFGATDAEGRTTDARDGEILSDQVYRFLSGEIDSLRQVITDTRGALVEIRPPADTRTIRGRTSAERATAAKVVAEQMHADVVLYGNYVTRNGETQFEPEFYISPRRLNLAEEFAGNYTLGAAVEALDSPTAFGVTPEEFRLHVQDRLKGVARFVFGLSRFAHDRYAESLAYFIAAENVWGTEPGREVLFLFIGAAYARQKDWDGADSAYQLARAVDPEYARAYLGLGDVWFQKGKDNCEADRIDEVDLRRSKAAFETASLLAITKDQPPAAFVPTKAAFGVGRTELCLSQAEVATTWGFAEVQFQRVISDYLQAHNPALKELAAESYANLAIIYSPGSDNADAAAVAAGHRRSVDAYTEALSLYAEPVERPLYKLRRAAIRAARAYSYRRLRDFKASEADYAAAIRENPAGRARYEAARQAMRNECGAPCPGSTNAP